MDSSVRCKRTYTRVRSATTQEVAHRKTALPGNREGDQVNTNTSIQAPYQAQPMDALTVHGVSIISRYNNPREIDEMTKFCELLVQRGLIDHIDSVFYDTGANLCSFNLSGKPWSKRTQWRKTSNRPLWKPSISSTGLDGQNTESPATTIQNAWWLNWKQHRIQGWVRSEKCTLKIW